VEKPGFVTQSSFTRAKILEPVAEGVFRAVTLCDAPEETLCDVLVTSERPLNLYPGDEVVLAFTGESERPFVLGRIGPSAEARETPDEIVLEAKKGLVLRVGEGSITIRADGKILIKGNDLVSHAKRMNRIRGGSVALN
jgi:hypothetical protein